MFNETPVVGGPLGFVAVDWHLDAVRSVQGAGLSLAGSWHHSRACCSQQVRAGRVSQAEQSVQACSHVFPRDLGWLTVLCLPEGTAPTLQEEDPSVPRNPSSPTNTRLGVGRPSPPPISPVPSVQMRKLRPQQVKEFAQVDIAISRTRNTALRHKPLLSFKRIRKEHIKNADYD